MHTRIYVALMALVAGFLLFVGGYAVGHDGDGGPSGYVDLTGGWIQVTGHEGQVYVVDSGRRVDADDHAAHMEHG